MFILRAISNKQGYHDMNEDYSPFSFPILPSDLCNERFALQPLFYFSSMHFCIMAIFISFNHTGN